MSRKNSARNFIPSKSNKIPSIDEILNEYFESEDGANKKLQDFFKAYYGFLQSAREERIEEIVESLTSVSNDSVSESYSRMVDLTYGDPLSVVGSLIGPGQRFNIGEGMGHTKPFACLYVANDYHTAFCEFHHYPPSYLRGGLDASKMALKKPENEMHVRVQVNIEKCIDLRDKENLRDFTRVISEIKPTDEFKKWAKELGHYALRTVQTHGELYRTLLDQDFLRSYYSLEIPSNSQWFGYYCLRAGIQGIIYPSVRDEAGNNIGILIDNLKDTDSTIKLDDNIALIPDDRKILRADNYEFFKIKTATKKVLN